MSYKNTPNKHDGRAVLFAVAELLVNSQNIELYLAVLLGVVWHSRQSIRRGLATSAVVVP